MQHENYKPKVQARFEAAKGSELLAAHQLSLRCDIAREMLEEEPEEVKARLRQEIVEEHAELLAEHKEACEGAPSGDPDNREEWVFFYLNSAGVLTDDASQSSEPV
jgi:hypothetical protein